MGVHMGKRLLGAGDGNVKGHFENIQFIFLNHIILQLAGGWSFMPPTAEEIISVRKRAEPVILETLQEEAQGDIWGWKAPATSITIHAIHPYLENPHYIIMRRSKDEVAKSFMKRNNKPRALSNKIYDKYISSIRKFVKNNKPKHLNVEFRHLVQDPKECLTKVCDFLDFEGDIDKGANFIDPSLKHF